MKRQTTNNRFPAILALLALLCALGSAALAGQVRELSQGAVVRWPEGEGVSPADLKRAERWAREDGEREGASLTLWQERPGEALKRADGLHGASATVLEFIGSAEELWPGELEAGSYPAPEDKEGCAVDRALAEALWGTGEAVGREIVWSGRSYYVRGVLRGDAGVALFQGGGATAQPYGNLLLRFRGGDASAQADALLRQNQWDGGTKLDLGLACWALELAAGLPAGLLCLGVLVRLFRRLRALAGTRVLLAAYLPPALGGAALALWAAGFPPYVPAQLIPTRWSDFDFWVRLASGRASEIRDYLALAPGARDARYWPLLLGGLLLALLACAFTVLSAERARAQTGRSLLQGWGFLLGAVFLIALGLGVSPGRAVWTMPLIWLAADYVLGKHAEYWKPRRGREEERHETGEPALEQAQEPGGGGDAGPTA